MKKNLLLNSTSGFMLYLTNVVITFVMAPIIVRTLGNTNYGAWDVVLSIAGYLGVLDLGISPAIVSLVARASAREDQRKIQSILNSSLYVFSLVGLLAMGVMLVLAQWSNRIINLDQGGNPDLKLVFTFLALDLLIQFPGTAFVAYLMGRMEHHFINALRTGLALLQAGLTYYLFLHFPHSGLLCLAILLFGVNLLQYLVITTRVMAQPLGMIIRPWRVERQTLRELLKFGFNSMLLMAADRIQRACVPLVIAHGAGLGQVVFYSVPNRLVEYGRGAANSIAFPMMPYYGYLDGQGDLGKRQQGWFELSRWIQMFILGAGILVLALGHDFIKIWMGPSYAEQGRWVLIFLGASLMAEGISPNSGRYLVGSGRHKLAARVQAALSVPALGLVFLFTRVFGVSGSAAVLLFAGATMTIIFWMLACADLKISPKDHLVKTLFPLAIPLGVLAATLTCMKILLPINGYLSLAVTAVVAAIAYFVAAWSFSLMPSERSQIRQRVASLLVFASER